MINGEIEVKPANLAPCTASVRPLAKADKLLAMELGRPSVAVNVSNKDPFSPLLELQESLLFNSSGVANLSPYIVPTYPVGTVVDLVFVVKPSAPSHSTHGRETWRLSLGGGAAHGPGIQSLGHRWPKPDSFN